MDQKVKISLIVAVDQNGVIGDGEKMLWHLPKELAYFKKMTLGKAIIMGRRTFLSIGRPLTGRTNIVLTSHYDWSAMGVLVAHTLEEALNIAERDHPGGEHMIVGGGEVYNFTLQRAQTVYLTRLKTTVTGSVRFPDMTDAEWTQSGDGEEDSDQGIEYTKTVLVRR